MKHARITALMLLVVFLLSSMVFPAIADTITIDLGTASYNEIVAALTLLRQAQVERLTQQFKSDRVIEPADGIIFRGLPWLSTRAEAESVLGAVSWAHSYIYLTLGKAYTSGIGARTEYNDWTVTGYPTKGSVNYVYPVREGILLRDDSLALLYLAVYEMSDIGNTTAVVDDISAKLSKLYGEYVRAGDGDLVWTDAVGNTITISSYSSRIDIMYRYHDTERLLAEADKAVDNERARDEELLRIQNSDNIDGL